MQGSFSTQGYVFEYGFAIEAKSQSLPWVKQVHGTEALSVQSPLDTPQARCEGDAVLTHFCEQEIYVYTADCLPVLLMGVDRDSKPHLAAIHSGWRGTMRGIVPEVLKQWPVDEQKTHVVLGPAIRSCHFEVKADFIEAFGQAAPSSGKYLDQRDGKSFFDLSGFVVGEQLKGFPSSSLDLTHQLCTVCHEPALPSFRRNKSTDPQIRAWIRAKLS